MWPVNLTKLAVLFSVFVSLSCDKEYWSKIRGNHKHLLLGRGVSPVTEHL